MAGMNYHYYNENDPYAAQWLRNLMAAGHIPEGCVDTRSIVDVQPEDLAVFTQCHFFAGIGGWPLALRLAGWPVDKPVWTGSCPCQPFSVAGKRKGNSDERHLWPEFLRLIATCNPATVFGEQVASKDGREWLSGVRNDLENIQLWQQFYKDMHEVQARSSLGELPQVLREVTRRAEATMQRMPESLRTALAQRLKGIPARDEEEEGSQGSCLPPELRRNSPGKDVEPGSWTAGEQKGHSVRPVSVRGADRRTDSSGVRNDGTAVRPSLKGAGLELPLYRQDHTGRGICLHKYQDRLLCDERGDGQLGRDCLTTDHYCVAGKAIADDQRKLAGVFNKMLNSKDGREWLSGVRADLEAVGYAVGGADLCAASAGAPHIRQRLFWVADSPEQGDRWRGLCGPGEGVSASDQRASGQSGGRGFADGLEHATGDGREQRGAESVGRGLEPRRSTNGLGNPIEPGLEGFAGNGDDGDQPGRDSAQPGGPITAPGGFDFWGDFDLVHCRDGKTRRIESGTFPLAHGVPGRVGKLRAYGNAILPQVAARFIEAFLEAAP